ncbi:(2Fe-2S)-binding protein [Salipiger bermudensis]|uniref:(2Fe-2S)-binding protein n=1 Tax=Salipiger bermudensis TaxID=344736 RepID=UPI001CD2EF97|nr:(2Fe-2S)-binding protein [Salipiger bermudensis]MCA1283752.1 (2Fe-2S)-binding protein [Salipiger bermudensis]
MAKLHVTTTINGDEVEFLARPDQTLLSALRDELNLTGSKEGCGSGDCGACSIEVNGRVTCACLMLAAEAGGKTITTIEGVADHGELHPVQRHFLQEAALQCGFCTPGIIVAAKNLLERNPDPTEEEIRFWLAGNLCRCTGYDKIIRAVQAAAEEMRAPA